MTRKREDEDREVLYGVHPVLEARLFDLYAEVAFNHEDELLASVGETKQAMLGIKGWF